MRDRVVESAKQTLVLVRISDRGGQGSVLLAGTAGKPGEREPVQKATTVQRVLPGVAAHLAGPGAYRSGSAFAYGQN